ncbi:D-alanyl-D-alanine carboxypeptidase family protein [Prosthecobacter vanneervenii]|uniref:D-alanyl-D-alanine carboxypeptidase (Penicillin-binding protein 5/6) n=1 Tax=Prosthecobacter vanneervenii TaxID=48466 RepID=A0A7W7YBY0_9BACT|nr:D-alanyl-D-alanine carboxypeptidase family protein [Prosthecobacter vanneervenii]MBB5033368.1 D-alanyl-D-alanine carboxypeptidase (penicillin-binding protein 5/6) [Prosthecobacter vanneervenii]
MIFRCQPPYLRRAMLAGLFCASITGCDDPKREQQLQWREEEVEAKSAAISKREKEFAAEKQMLAQAKADIAAREAAVEQLKKKLETQLADEIEKTKKVRREIEIKNLRGSIPQITAGRCIVIDPETDDVLFEKNPDQRGAIASTTKIMTGLLVVEAGDLDKVVTVELADTQCAPVRIGLKVGEQYTRRQLLTAMLVKSSNDIAQALARDNAGSVAAFAQKMDDRARQLGLQNTHFVNPHGLPSLTDEDPYSTARDLAVIAKAADKLPDIRAIVKLQSYKFVKPDGKSIDLANTNRVLRTASYCDGMKTGFTEAAGYCLVATGERNGRRRIVVILNDSHEGVWRDAQALLDWALKA